MEEREITLEQESSKELEIELIREGGSSGGGTKEVHVGTEEPTDENIVIWIDPSEEADKIPTKTSELENDSNFITEKEIEDIVLNLFPNGDEVSY